MDGLSGTQHRACHTQAQLLLSRDGQRRSRSLVVGFQVIMVVPLSSLVKASPGLGNRPQ
jgi:hypothetical protein